MATYFCSDIHGEYALFCRLLDKIGYSSSYDAFYVLGDMIDKGKDPVRLVNLLMSLGGVRAILGNHEHYFLRYCSSCLEDYARGVTNDVETALGKYFSDYKGAVSLEVADYIDSLPCFIEEDDFICVHAGVALDDDGKILPMARQDENVMIFDRSFKDASVIPVDGKTVLFGHTPCCYDNRTGKFIKTLKKGVRKGEKLSDYAKIRLDTGAMTTGMIGCLRMEDMAEFYVTKE